MLSSFHAQEDYSSARVATRRHDQAAQGARMEATDRKSADSGWVVAPQPQSTRE
jgi:hypothetical protein